jgi:hypothetical protein
MIKPRQQQIIQLVIKYSYKQIIQLVIKYSYKQGITELGIRNDGTTHTRCDLFLLSERLSSCLCMAAGANHH